jgi:hypothetical protein
VAALGYSAFSACQTVVRLVGDRAVARLTTMTYAGILLAPPAIGAVAQRVGLVTTLALLAPLLAAVSALAGRVRPLPPS